MSEMLLIDHTSSSHTPFLCVYQNQVSMKATTSSSTLIKHARGHKYTLSRREKHSVLELMTQLWFFFLQGSPTHCFSTHTCTLLWGFDFRYFHGSNKEATNTHAQCLFIHTCRAGSESLCPQCINTHIPSNESFCIKCVCAHELIGKHCMFPCLTACLCHPPQRVTLWSCWSRWWSSRLVWRNSTCTRRNTCCSWPSACSPQVLPVFVCSFACWWCRCISSWCFFFLFFLKSEIVSRLSNYLLSTGFVLLCDPDSPVH